MFRLLGFLLLLSGCVSTEQDSQQCAAYGFKPGTDGFATCLMSLSEQRQARAAQIGAAMQIAGNSYANSYRTTQCTYTGYGNTVYQTCR